MENLIIETEQKCEDQHYGNKFSEIVKHVYANYGKFFVSGQAGDAVDLFGKYEEEVQTARNIKKISDDWKLWETSDQFKGLSLRAATWKNNVIASNITADQFDNQMSKYTQTTAPAEFFTAYTTDLQNGYPYVMVYGPQGSLSKSFSFAKSQNNSSGQSVKEALQEKSFSILPPFLVCTFVAGRNEQPDLVEQIVLEHKANGKWFHYLLQGIVMHPSDHFYYCRREKDMSFTVFNDSYVGNTQFNKIDKKEACIVMYLLVHTSDTNQAETSYVTHYEKLFSTNYTQPNVQTYIPPTIVHPTPSKTLPKNNEHIFINQQGDATLSSNQNLMDDQQKKEKIVIKSKASGLRKFIERPKSRSSVILWVTLFAAFSGLTIVAVWYFFFL